MVSKKRIVLLILLGSLLFFLIYVTKYSSFIFFDFFIYGLIIIFSAVLVWSVYKDVFVNKSLQGIRRFISSIIGIAFALVMLVMKINNHHLLHKETYLLVYYNGDFNGTSIDFKTDGTLVVNDFCLGLGTYTYGSYEIRDSSFVLKTKEKIKNRLLKTNYVIRKNEQGVDYLYSLDDNGNVNVDDYLIYRVIVDNRNKKDG